MANEKNLKPIKKGELTKEEAKKRGSKGGKKSVQARREKKLFKEVIEERLGTKINTVVDAMIEMASIGNVQAATWLRDTKGEKPTDIIEVTKPTTETENEIDKILNE